MENSSSELMRGSISYCECPRAIASLCASQQDTKNDYSYDVFVYIPRVFFHATYIRLNS